MPAAPTAIRYKVQLDQLESCNCPTNCPCQFGGTPTYTSCHFLIGYRVQEGIDSITAAGDPTAAGERAAS